jgi:PIN domain nuclease of toxin-antitoxin system
VRMLVDTHALLWFALNDSQLSSTADALIRNRSNLILVSPISYWEIAIKMSTGKYSLTVPYSRFFQDAIFGNGFSVLPIEIKHAAIIATLPFHHKDPFDRLLIAQALSENIPILSADAAFDPYGVTRLW